MAKRHPSAIKRNRQNIKRRTRNRAVISRVRTVIRKTRDVIEGKDTAAAPGALRDAVRILAKAGSKGVLHKNAVARRISRLSKQVSALTRAG